MADVSELKEKLHTAVSSELKEKLLEKDARWPVIIPSITNKDLTGDNDHLLFMIVYFFEFANVRSQFANSKVHFSMRNQAFSVCKLKCTLQQATPRPPFSVGGDVLF